MNVAYYIKKERLKNDAGIRSVLDSLRSGGVSVYDVSETGGILPSTDMLLCFGGDGTFLSAAVHCHAAGVPILGVNLGRLGFLSESRKEDIAGHILSGDYRIEYRRMLSARIPDGTAATALNEISLLRVGSGTIGIDVSINGDSLPTYWADGLLVATSSGSTAYNLAVGGPICLPDTDVLVVSPIAPHNLGVRPLVIPSSSKVRMTLKTRKPHALLAMDNRSMTVPSGTSIEVEVSPVPLGKVTIGKSNFIEALKNRFFWGMDVRNSSDSHE